ncbi:MAG: ABC transporter permease [Promethearchaeota archaeon]
MVKKAGIQKNFKFPIVLLSILFFSCFLMQNSSLISNPPYGYSELSSNRFHTSVTYEYGNIPIINTTINDNILIKLSANVTITNSTIQGSIYLFNWATLYLNLNTNVTGDIIISDYSRVYMVNSTVNGRIESRGYSSLELYNCNTPSSEIWKFDSANITIDNCFLAIFNEYGVAGQIQITNSQMNLVLDTLFGVSTARTYIDNSTITFLLDSKKPYNFITGPIRYEYIIMNYSYTTSQRQINLTWIGWDSPIIDGYLNITFQILFDNQVYAEINGSGFFDQYSGYFLINFTSTGQHNISVVSIDSNGNNYTSTINIEIIEYPPFPWVIFFLIVAIIAGIILTAIAYLRYQKNRGFGYSIGNIFKKEILESKLKLIIFIAIAAAPGILLYFIFSTLGRAFGTPSIDNIRGLVSMIFTLFLYYFGLAFSIVFAAGAVVNERKSGALSWFLSKPVRRWEFLWGKILAYFFIIILVMISSAVAFVIGGISFIDPIYLPDLISMGGYIFLIGILSMLPLTAIVILCSSLFKKPGFTIFLPIILLIIIPPILSFLPIVTKNEYPLLFSFTFYSETLGNHWIYNGGGLFSSIGSGYGEMFGITISPLNLTPLYVVLILSSITIVCLVIATYSLQKTDIA